MQSARHGLTGMFFMVVTFRKGIIIDDVISGHKRISFSSYRILPALSSSKSESACKKLRLEASQQNLTTGPRDISIFVKIFFENPPITFATICPACCSRKAARRDGDCFLCRRATFYWRNSGANSLQKCMRIFQKNWHKILNISRPCGQILMKSCPAGAKTM